jgi:excisionase family DNA binding protein
MAFDQLTKALKEEIRQELKAEMEQMMQEAFETTKQNRTLSVKQAYRYIGLDSEDTLRNMVRDEQIPYFRARGRIFFREASLDRWMEEQEKQNYKPWQEPATA